MVIKDDAPPFFKGMKVYVYLSKTKEKTAFSKLLREHGAEITYVVNKKVLCSAAWCNF